MLALELNQVVRYGCCLIWALAALGASSARGALGWAIGAQETSGGVDPYPIAVAVSNRGTIYVADKAQKIVYRIDDTGKPVVLYKGSRKYRTPLYNVMAMAADDKGNVYLCDTGSMDVWRLSADGQLSPLTAEKLDRPAGGSDAGAFDREARYAGKFDKPMGIAIDPQGNPVVADLGRGAIFRVPASGGEPQEIARVPAPHGIALDRDGTWVVVSQAKDQLLRVSPTGEVTPIVKGALAPKNNPHQVVVDQAGYMVTDNYAAAVWRVSPDGQVKPIAQGAPLHRPVGIALEAGGNVLVADPWARTIFRLTPDGKITEVVSFPSAAETD
jgi:sugar lactone lactonase YvrE